MDINALKEEYSKLHGETGAVISSAAKESRGLNGEEKAENDKRYARMDEIKSVVDASAKQAAYAFASGKAEAVEPKGKAVVDAIASASQGFSKEQERAALNEFLRFGEIRSRDLFSTISTSGSSAALPKTVLSPASVLTPSNPYKAVLAAYGVPVLTLGNTSNVSIPLINDSGNIGATKTEGDTSETAPVDPTLTSIALNTVLKESKPSWFSNTLLNANSFDLLSYCLPKIEQRLERAKHSAMDTAIKAATTGAVTAATSIAITYKKVLDWEHSLPNSYRYNTAMVVSDSFYALLRGLVDSQNRPIMDQDPVNVFQSKVHNIPVFVSEYLSAVGANNYVGALVNADSLYIREEASRVTRYTNVPSYPDQFGINIFQDAAVAVDNNGVRLFRMGATS